MRGRTLRIRWARARPEGLQGLRRPRPLRARARRGGRVRDRPRLRRAVRAAPIAVGRDMRVSAPDDGRRVMEGAADGGADVLDLGMVGTEMVYFAVGELGLDGGICVTASHNPKEYTGMKIVRRGALPVGGDSGLERRPRPRAAAGFGAVARARRDHAARRLARRSSTRCSRSSTSTRSSRCASSSTPRTGWPGRCCRPCSSGCRRSTSSAATSSRTARSRTTSRTRCSPENRRVHRREDARGGRRPRRRVRRRRRPLLLRRRHRRVRPRRLRHRAARPGDAGEGARRKVHLRRPRELGGAAHDRGGRRRPRSSAASATPSSSSACARRTRSSPARSRRTTTSATSRRPTRASSRSCSCSSCSRSAARSCPRSCARSASATSSPARSTRRSRTWRRSCRSSKERYAAEGGRISHLDGISVDFDDWHFNVRPSNTEPLVRLNLEALSEDEMATRRDEVVGADPELSG